MSEAPAPLCPDTSSYSLLHRLAREPGSQPPRLVRVYLVVVAVTYLPLLLAAKLGSVPLWEASRAGPLTFLQDWGLGYALLSARSSIRSASER
jgi:hypothetical protein